MSGKKNQGEDIKEVTPTPEVKETTEDAFPEVTSLIQEKNALAEQRDELLNMLSDITKERDEAKELIVTQDAQIDHLKEVIESLKGSEDKAKDLIKSSVESALNKPVSDPLFDLRATLDKHPEHTVIYAKGDAFSFRKPQDLKGWDEKTREEILACND